MITSEEVNELIIKYGIKDYPIFYYQYYITNFEIDKECCKGDLYCVNDSRNYISWKLLHIVKLTNHILLKITLEIKEIESKRNHDSSS